MHAFALIGSALRTNVGHVHDAQDTTMKKEPLECPHCDTTLKPERIDAGRYVCQCCSRVFFVPKGLRA